MSDSPPIHSWRIPSTASVIFAAGLVSVPCIFAAASKLSQPPWDWETSTFGHVFAWPLLVLSLCCCLGAPLLSRMSIARKLALSAGALFAFAVVLLATLAVCVMAFGTGIR